MTFFIFLIILVIFVTWASIEVNQWWKVRKEYVRMGLASDKFPYGMYVPEEFVKKCLSLESQSGQFMAYTPEEFIEKCSLLELQLVR